MSQETRSTRLYQSMVRPHLLMGGERSATLLNGGAAITIYFLTLSIPGIIAGVLTFTAVQTVLRILARQDPQMISIVFRARKWQDYYPDAPSLDAPVRVIPVEKSQQASIWNQILSRFAKKDRKHAEPAGIPE